MQYPAHAYSAKTITCAEFGWICIVHNHRNHADTIISQSAYPRSFVAMVPRWDSNQILMILILLWLHLQFQKSGNHVETLEG